MFSVRLVLTTTLPSSLIQKQQEQTHNPQIKIYISTRSGYDYSSLYSQYYGSNYPYSMATGKEKEKHWKTESDPGCPRVSRWSWRWFPLQGKRLPWRSSIVLLQHIRKLLQPDGSTLQVTLTRLICRNQDYARFRGQMVPVLVRDNGQLMGEKATQNCLQKSVSRSNSDTQRSHCHRFSLTIVPWTLNQFVTSSSLHSHWNALSWIFPINSLDPFQVFKISYSCSCSHWTLWKKLLVSKSE